MKSGLYACGGASATASAAACANRLDEPITNRSNVYFGLRPGNVSRAGASSAVVTAARERDSSTRKRTEVSDELASLTAARTRLPKWVSIHSRVKLFGTATSSSPSESVTGRASPNQVR